MLNSDCLFLGVNRLAKRDYYEVLDIDKTATEGRKSRKPSGSWHASIIQI